LESEPRPHQEPGLLASRISREIVRVHARLYGRGPTRAKTYLNEDHALCVLEDVFTKAEQTLIRAGNAPQVQATRLAFKDAVGDEFTAIVEGVTGREVRAFVSQVDIRANLAVELFLFERREADVDEPEGADDE
jgi:uncharacterized protein YbcI